jgi:hypothetical protein
MSSIQSQPQTNLHNEFGNGIWKLWPFSVIARASRLLQKDQQFLEARLLRLSEQQDQQSLEARLLHLSEQQNQQSLEVRLLQLSEQQELLVIRADGLSVTIRKIEQMSLQHQQNSNVEIDRLEQEIADIIDDKFIPVEKRLSALQQQSANMYAEIESSERRIVDVLGALQRPRADAVNPQILKNSNLVKSAPSDLADQPAAIQREHLLETALNLMQKDIRALQAQVRAQAIRIRAVAAFSGETLPNVMGGDSDSGDIWAEEFKRLSTRERNIAQQFKHLSDTTR